MGFGSDSDDELGASEREKLLDSAQTESKQLGVTYSSDGQYGNSEGNSQNRPEGLDLTDQVDNEGELFERAITAAGMGPFHVILLLVCGWALASDSVEIQAVSFVLPSACDLKLTSNEKGWLNAVIFVGMMVGGYGFGGIADVKGRRFVMMTSMTINGLFGLASAFATNFLLFLFFRFLSGIGVGAAMPVVFSFFTEFLAKDKRGPMIGLLASFWMVGNIVTAGIAWLVIPRTGLGASVGTIWFGSWRIFVALCAFPSLSSAVFMFLMPESPKFLQKVGRYEEACAVFQRIYRSNNAKMKNSIPSEITNFPTYCINYASLTKEESQEKETLGCSENCRVTIRKIVTATIELFGKPLRRRSIIALVIWFTLSFGYYGLWMWFPELFQRIQSGESSCGRSSHHSSILPQSNETCEEKVVHNHEVYLESFLVAISNLPGNILTILFINKIGRRRLLALSMVVSGCSVFLFWFVTKKAEMIIMSCVFSGLSIAGWNALDVISMELYPTHLRSTAFGIQAAVGRVGSILANQIFGLLVDVHCSIPLLLVASLLFAGGLSALWLPKTDNEALH